MDKFTITGELPDLNQIIKASKAHFMAYSTLKKNNTALVVQSAKGLKKFERVNLNIIHYCSSRRKDPDNIQGGATKFILDGLVTAGILENDGWKQIGEIRHIMKIDRDNPRIEISIEEVIE